MKTDQSELPLADVIAEYTAIFEGDWKPKTQQKYAADFRRLLTWLDTEGVPATAAALDFATLLRYVGFLKASPVARGVWRCDPAAVARARLDATAHTLSLNTVNAYMRSIKSLCLWARDQGLLAINPFGRAYRRNKHHPLLPTEETPPKPSLGPSGSWSHRISPIPRTAPCPRVSLMTGSWSWKRDSGSLRRGHDSGPSPVSA